MLGPLADDSYFPLPHPLPCHIHIHSLLFTAIHAHFSCIFQKDCELDLS